MFRPRGNAGQARPSDRQPMPQLVSQPTSNAGPSHTPAAQPFYNPPRFLLQSRGNPEPANAPATSTSRATHRVSRPVDDIESDFTPTAPASRNSQQLTLQSGRNSNAGQPNAPVASSSSRITRRPMLQSMRNTGPASIGSVNIPSTSTTRGPRPFPLPGRTITGPTTTPTTSASRTTQQSTFRPVRATVPATTPTPTPSASAPVLEFVCLYTHDLRRKKKRWQDGKLKFHTFNKKYMVYDDGGSFVGDGHWQGDKSEFAEGLEMNLDRGMAIVQVMECTGSKEQDLGEVLGKRAREVEERRINAAAKTPASTTASSNPAKRSRGIAVVVEAPPTVIPLTPPKNGGAWSTHAGDLLGMTRPRRR